jgi:hypothetical protein
LGINLRSKIKVVGNKKEKGLLPLMKNRWVKTVLFFVMFFLIINGVFVNSGHNNSKTGIFISNFALAQTTPAETNWGWVKRKADQYTWGGKHLLNPVGGIMVAKNILWDVAGQTSVGQAASKKVDEVKAAVADKASAAFLTVFNALLYAILWVLSQLLIAAGFILDMAVDPRMFTNIMNNGAIRESWKFIRDMMNLVFILVLLFSAFCNIFRVDKWNLKKVLLTLVIMALLVNFSFPISRFIIDTGNILMYYLLNSAFPVNSGADSLSAKFTGITQISNMLLDVKIVGGWSITGQIVMNIIFMFILMATMMVTAVTLLVRIVVLAILVILSPGGFTASIFPATENLSKKWWDALFKYTFNGPILIFFMYLAINLMQKFQVNSISLNMSNKSTFIESVLFFAIPVTILWIGLSMAQGLGGVGGNLAMSKLKQAGNWARKQPWRATKAAARSTGIPGGLKQGLDNFKKTGQLYGKKPFGKFYGGTNARERREAQVGGAVSYGKGGWDAAASSMDRKRAREKADEFKKLNKSGSGAASDLTKANASGNKVDAMANAIYMMEQGLMNDVNRFADVLNSFSGDKEMQSKIIAKADKNIISDELEYEKVKSAIDPSLVKGLERKMVDEGNINVVIKHDMSTYGGSVAAGAAYNDRLEKLSPQDFAKQKKLDPSTDADFKNYLTYGIDAAARQNIARYLSNKDRTSWGAEGLL